MAEVVGAAILSAASAAGVTAASTAPAWVPAAIGSVVLAGAPLGRVASLMPSAKRRSDTEPKCLLSDPAFTTAATSIGLSGAAATTAASIAAYAVTTAPTVGTAILVTHLDCYFAKFDRRRSTRVRLGISDVAQATRLVAASSGSGLNTAGSQEENATPWS